MSSAQLQSNDDADVQLYEISIPVRGCRFDLKLLKNIYCELQKLSYKEADRLVDAFVRPENKSSEEFLADKLHIKNRAFRITVSIIGVDGQTSYGDTEKIFNLETLPQPIDTIYLTNDTAYNQFANGQSAANHFKLWIHFSKPPLLDGASLLTEPTPNHSKAYIRADDLTYFRAVQNIIHTRLMRQRLWYSFMHGRAVYDVGFWVLALPYSLYTATRLLDKYISSNGEYASFRVAGFIYGIGSMLMLYRVSMGYFKWAFPVNILNENKDWSVAHRLIFGALLLSVIGNALSALIGI